MKYYVWSPDDSDTDFVFFNNTEKGVRLRAQYQSFACPDCRKVNHYNALKQVGVDSTFVPVLYLDYQHTADGLACVSKRILDHLHEFRVDAFELFPIPNTTTHQIIWPKERAHVDSETSTVRFHGRVCDTCKEHLELTLRYDSFLGVTPPPERNSFFGIDKNCQGRRFCSTDLYMNATLKNKFDSLDLRLIGLTFDECGQFGNIELKQGWRRKEG